MDFELFIRFGDGGGVFEEDTVEFLRLKCHLNISAYQKSAICQNEFFCLEGLYVICWMFDVWKFFWYFEKVLARLMFA